jgi:hypothetical protein
MPIWQENPISLIGSFPSQISTGPTSFIVSVTSGSNPVNQAYVCLWKGTEIYETGSTNSAGEVTFSISPPSSGTMYVTITKQNYLPFEGSTLIMSGDNSPPQTPVRPTGQTTGKINVEYTYTTSTTDPENDQVYYKWSWGNEESGWMGPYSSGTTISVPHTWASAGTYNVKVKAKDPSDYESSWSSGLIVTITESSPNLSIGSISGGLLGISTEISNNGDASATNVNWNISISGGLLFSGQTQTGTLTTLNVDASEIIQDTPIIGFGTVTITVKVSADGVPEITKTADGFVFFIFVVV